MTSVAASLTVPADPAEAFRMFTEQVDQWYVVDRHTVADYTRTVRICFEPWVGGRFLDVQDAVTGDGQTMGVVTRWDPPYSLSFRDGRDTLVEVRFEPDPRGTRVRIEQSGLERLDPAVREHVSRYAWPRTLLPWFEAYADRAPILDRASTADRATHNSEPPRPMET